ncbi:MAG: response regulator transcription factor [Candidatus Omnitrophota bacterium]
MAIEVVLVDDHDIVRQGIRAVISQDPGISIVGEAANGREAIDLVKKKKPDVVIMDVSLPLLNGLDASAEILKRNSDVKILILSMHENRVFIEKALSHGVRGYVLKDCAVQEIVTAIKEVVEGRFFLSSRISSFVVQDYVSRKRKSLKLKSSSALTPREREILQLIAEGQNSKDIASKLGLSLKTVLVHRNNIMQKLDIHNQAQLIRFALKEGITSL